MGGAGGCAWAVSPSAWDLSELQSSPEPQLLKEAPNLGVSAGVRGGSERDVLGAFQPSLSTTCR